jgi:hydroxymethylglutaryl-CoA lyase
MRSDNSLLLKAHALPATTMEIVEVGPRDGLQGEQDFLPTAVKVGLIERLLAAGVRRIEVASFVSPRKVPQMADAEQVFAALPVYESARYIGLVLNRKGLERALAAGCQEIGMVVSASDTFNRRNQGSSTNDSLAAWREISSLARAAGVHSQVMIATSFGCPFEGEVPPARVIDIARRAAAECPVEIGLADTIGAGVPEQVTELINRVREALPGMPLRGHFHNTRNTGIANAQAAIQAGIRILDSSVGGLGGCPFAPGATGNIATEDLLYLLKRSGIQSGISINEVIETSRWLQEQLGRPLPSALLKAGIFPRAKGIDS